MKKQKIGRLLIWFLGGIFVLSALVKFSGVGQMTDMFVSWGLYGWLIPIAAIELLAGGLLLFDTTWLYGSWLLSAYLGGAIATHLIHGELTMLLLPAVLLVVLWIGTFLRQPQSMVFIGRVEPRN